MAITLRNTKELEPVRAYEPDINVKLPSSSVYVNAEPFVLRNVMAIV